MNHSEGYYPQENRKHGTVMNLSRSGRPTKFTPRALRRLFQQVIKELTTTSKELQASLASVKVSVHDSTMRMRRGRNGSVAEFQGEKNIKV